MSKVQYKHLMSNYSSDINVLRELNVMATEYSEKKFQFKHAERELKKKRQKVNDILDRLRNNILGCDDDVKVGK